MFHRASILSGLDVSEYKQDIQRLTQQVTLSLCVSQGDESGSGAQEEVASSKVVLLNFSQSKESHLLFQQQVLVPETIKTPSVLK